MLLVTDRQLVEILNNIHFLFFNNPHTHDRYVHMMDSVITPTHVSQSIYDQSRNDPDFSLLVENIDFVRLTDLVDRDLPLTMLVAPNRAFERIEFSTIDGGDIIRWHIFRGLFFTDIIANLTTITSVEPNPVTHTVERKGPEGEHLYVGGAYIYEGDVLARNGVLHKIDRVIGFEYPTVAPSTSPAPTVTPEPTIFVPPTLPPEEAPQGPAKFTFPPMNNDVPTPGNNPGNGQNGGGSAAPSMFSLSLFSIIALAAATFRLV